MLAGGDAVLIALSGGADSVALLVLLHRLAPEWGLRLHALHVDHGLRPESGLDAEFVRGLCGRLGVPLDVVRVTVPETGSVEAAARAARYAALEAAAEGLGARRIAVGHTADDQAETVLMRIIEGAGVRGLAGIPPVRGRIVRPLIGESRAALVAMLREAKVDWVEDASNRDPRFLRNRIRHELLPLLAVSYRHDVAAALRRLGRLARETTDALDRMAGLELARLAVTDGGDALVLPLPALAALPRPVAAEILRQASTRLGARAPLRAWAHRGLRRILDAPSPRRAFRLGGVTIETSCGRLRLGSRPAPALAPRELAVPGVVALPEAGLVLEATVRPRSGYAVPRDPHRVAFDAGAVPGTLLVRARRPGDRLVPFGSSAERRLKTILIDAKVPRWERGRVPIVEATGEILWVAGLRRAALAPVTEATATVVELSLRAVGLQALAEAHPGR
jgi:tRNA(Ile)-lysidine synthase